MDDPNPGEQPPSGTPKPTVSPNTQPGAAAATETPAGDSHSSHQTIHSGHHLHNVHIDSSGRQQGGDHINVSNTHYHIGDRVNPDLQLGHQQNTPQPNSHQQNSQPPHPGPPYAQPWNIHPQDGGFGPAPPAYGTRPPYAQHPFPQYSYAQQWSTPQSYEQYLYTEFPYANYHPPPDFGISTYVPTYVCKDVREGVRRGLRIEMSGIPLSSSRLQTLRAHLTQTEQELQGDQQRHTELKVKITENIESFQLEDAKLWQMRFDTRTPLSTLMAQERLVWNRRQEWSHSRYEASFAEDRTKVMVECMTALKEEIDREAWVGYNEKKKRPTAQKDSRSPKRKVASTDDITDKSGSRKRKAASTRDQYDEAGPRKHNATNTEDDSIETAKAALTTQPTGSPHTDTSDWLDAVVIAFNSYPDIAVFPTPPVAVPCSEATAACRNADRVLPGCQCNTNALFRQAAAAGLDLKRERPRWHPDRFEVCAEDKREEWKRAANEIFVAIGTVIEEMGEDGNGESGSGEGGEVQGGGGKGGEGNGQDGEGDGHDCA